MKEREIKEESKEGLMLNIIKKSMLTGIGLALIAKDELEVLAKEFVKNSLYYCDKVISKNERNYY